MWSLFFLHVIERVWLVVADVSFHTIPLWFSRNNKMLLNDAIFAQFPYHYGSHATIMSKKLNVIKFVVSIPLWFSRNWNVEVSFQPVLKFPYHYGSHATC